MKPFSARKNLRVFLYTFLKVVIFMATLYYIYLKIKENPDFSNFFSRFSALDLKSFSLLVIVFLAMFLNWGLESGKWKLLVSKFDKITFLRAFKAVWSGTVFNNWIPNRLGEFIGRISFIRFRYRPYAVFSAVLGNAAQWLMTFTLGCTGLLFYVYEKKPFLVIPLSAICLALIICLFYLYFNLQRIKLSRSRFKVFRQAGRYAKVFSWYGKSDLSRVLGLSFLRYMTYLFQYYLLLLCFGIHADALALLSSVALIFLVQAVLPSFLWTEIGIRGAAVLFFVGRFSQDTNAMLAAAYSLWFINLLLPSFIGALFILFLKIPKSKFQIKKN